MTENHLVVQAGLRNQSVGKPGPRPESSLSCYLPLAETSTSLEKRQLSDQSPYPWIEFRLARQFRQHNRRQNRLLVFQSLIRCLDIIARFATEIRDQRPRIDRNHPRPFCSRVRSSNCSEVLKG